MKNNHNAVTPVDTGIATLKVPIASVGKKPSCTGRLKAKYLVSVANNLDSSLKGQRSGEMYTSICSSTQ